MRRLGKIELKVSQILAGVATGLLLVGVACGAAATATPASTNGRQPTAARPLPSTALAATASATPAPTPAPAAKVNPGKLTIMVGDLYRAV